jgi:hypothetical protein
MLPQSQAEDGPGRGLGMDPSFRWGDEFGE